MKVYCDNISKWRRRIPSKRKGLQYPCIILEKDNWDDFGYETTYRASIYRNSTKREHYGEIKFLNTEQKKTVLPEQFESLPDEYCSLWQELKDYKVINELEFGKDIFDSLNDINYNEILRDKFSLNRGLKDSLRRFSDAERAYIEGHKYITNNLDKSSFAFRYIEDEMSSTPFGTFAFKFSRKLLGMYRVIGLIGRNGVGKTTLLANLASMLSGVQKKSAKISPRPPFSKIIAVSYSTFDDFYRPSKNERTFSYTYCGIRGDRELLNHSEIVALFSKNYNSLLKKERENLWTNCMNILYLNKLDTYFPSTKNVIQSFRKLSSGQKIMTLSFTQIINSIDTNSLLLFDEPENHLHPNGQNTLFKALDYILNTFDSFSVISTHSPIFIQNIPQKNVFKINSVSGVRSVTNLNIETFGQHFSKLTEVIFGFSENNLFYVEKLKSIVEEKEELGIEYDEIQDIKTAGVEYNLSNFLND
ncbi:AAA family ATPase [uncultured Tenacibaculum sp.]|uniref:AAA family ATPase n=1 Tax=uncultured Tenacibaculum sp. TaxID=174713 RepID=UPI0026079251|nr:AAA family ATPase [uncultured Tenacibaculum sp.]